MYGVMDDSQVRRDVQGLPAPLLPAVVQPSECMEETLRVIKAKKKLEEAFPMLRGEEGKAKECDGLARDMVRDAKAGEGSNKIVIGRVIEAVEKRNARTARPVRDLNFDFVFHVALGRRPATLWANLQDKLR